jgi:hypothetical protein
VARYGVDAVADAWEALYGAVLRRDLAA